MSRIIGWFRNLNQHFTDTCRLWYKKWSTWLAAFFSLVVTFFWNETSVLQEIANAVPGDIRARLSPVIFIVVAGLPILVAHLKQKNLHGDQ